MKQKREEPSVKNENFLTVPKLSFAHETSNTTEYWKAGVTRWHKFWSDRRNMVDAIFSSLFLVQEKVKMAKCGTFKKAKVFSSKNV